MLRLPVLGAEIGEGLRGVLREPTALAFSVLMPVGFHALFTSVVGMHRPVAGLPYAARLSAHGRGAARPRWSRRVGPVYPVR